MGCEVILYYVVEFGFDVLLYVVQGYGVYIFYVVLVQECVVKVGQGVEVYVGFEGMLGKSRFRYILVMIDFGFGWVVGQDSFSVWKIFGLNVSIMVVMSVVMRLLVSEKCGGMLLLYWVW